MRRSKYGVRIDRAGKEARTVDNITFDSLKEAHRYSQLKLLSRAGHIKDLIADKKQIKWKLTVNGIAIGTYTADFLYWERLGETDKWKMVIEDVKGHRTRDYVMKRRLMMACHNIEIREV